ncbi:MAG: aspartate/glutamate racemase family protein [Burkholderiaceae bacterium]|jgi:aspartate racemase|nr:MAG: aspartate/glutamate racemase family protein [Burkholderiaceae bacterium]
MKTIGLLAAFGPVAGAHFYTRLLQLVDAQSDADYPAIVLLSRPDIPDRIDFLLHDGPSPVPWFIEMTQQLNALHVDVIAIASATSHAFLPDVEKVSHAPAVNLLAAVGAEVARQRARRIGLLGTSASVRLHLYEPHLPQGSTVTSPPEAVQTELDRIIYAFKRGESTAKLAIELLALIDQPWAAGIETWVLGCTELHLVAAEFQATHRAIDSVDCLARAVLEAADIPMLP